ncbi:Uncharacterised protein [Legionella beliardensis]|uniref:Coiled coil protein n=1 Tax=Legionella beliardensis TaxID=91822 RepID=A0A378HZX5_9GAMM|nr:hypothetical protein [Legionella beliardensis]STX28282.1 Uncharacterised protein [Legionella beliardensis]
MSDYEKKLNSGKTIEELILEGNVPEINILSKIKATLKTIKDIEKKYGISLFPAALAEKDLDDLYDLRSIRISDIIDLLQNLNDKIEYNSLEQDEIAKKLTTLQDMQKNLQDERTDIGKKRDAKFLRITDIQMEIEKLASPHPFPAVPSGLDRFLADKNPGFFKSIAMSLLNSFWPINDSKKKCIEYDSANENNMRKSSLEAQKTSLEEERVSLLARDSSLKDRTKKLGNEISSQQAASIKNKPLISALESSVDTLKENLADLLSAKSTDEKSQLNQALDACLSGEHEEEHEYIGVFRMD